MYPVSRGYLDAIRGPHQAYGYLEAWYNGHIVTLPDGSTRLPMVTDGTNSIMVDAKTPGVRRTLSCTLAPMPGLFDSLQPIGTEIRAYTTVRYPSGATETVPQGVYVIDVQTMGYAASGNIGVTAPDRWVLVQNGRFLTPRASSYAMRLSSQIASLILEVAPAGTVVTDLSTSGATVPGQTWDRDRDKAIQDMATAASLDVFFDRSGAPVIRDAPVLNPAASVWTVDASQQGVLIDASRQRDRQKTYNIVVVNGTRADGSVPFATQYVWDADPTSVTYCGPGSGISDTPPPAGSAGPFGQRPYFYSSPLLNDFGQARSAGVTIRERVRGLATQLTLTSVSNSALDDGDTITVALPRERVDMAQPVESHLIDSLTIPLVPSKNAQTITTRSTRPDDTGGS